MKLFSMFSLVILLFAGFQFADFQEAKDANNAITSKAKNKIEVIDFHTTHRCKTCLKIENSTKKVLQTEFSKEMKSGVLSFKTINIDKKENYAIAERFEAAGTALFLNVVKNGKEAHIDLTDFAFLKVFEDDAFYKELKAKINAQLKTL